MRFGRVGALCALVTVSVMVRPLGAGATTSVDVRLHWAGYDMATNSLGQFGSSGIETGFTVPTFDCSASKNNSHLADWDGFGGVTGPNFGVLVQAGVDSQCVKGHQVNTPFWEVFGGNLPEDSLIQQSFSQSMSIMPGDSMYVQVDADLTASSQTVFFQLTNLRSEVEAFQSAPVGERVGNTAECIAERPYTTKKSIPPLPSFSSVSFSTCDEFGSDGTSSYIWDVPTGVAYSNVSPAGLPDAPVTAEFALVANGVYLGPVRQPVVDPPYTPFTVQKEALTTG